MHIYIYMNIYNNVDSNCFTNSIQYLIVESKQKTYITKIPDRWLDHILNKSYLIWIVPVYSIFSIVN